MLRLQYLLKNLFRKPLRTMMTIVAVAAPFFVYVLGMAIVRNFDLFLEQSVQQMRLAVVQKSSIINPLPEGHRRKIEALDPTGTHIVSVCGMRWFGGKIPDTQIEVPFIAVDVDTFPRTYPELNLTEAQIKLWNSDKRAAVVGRSPAGQLNWKEGDVVTVESTVPPYLKQELLIVAIPPNAIDPETSFMRYDAFNDRLKALGFMGDRVSFFFVKCATRADVWKYRDEIDAAFAIEQEQTKTQDEKAFMESFISAQFDLPTRLRLLSYVVVSVAILAAANTMMMTFRDRIGEYAIFKAIGFPLRSIAASLTAESVLLSLIGGLLGAGIPFIAFNYTPLQSWRLPVLGILQVRSDLVVESLVVTLIVGIVAAVFPVLRAARLHVVDALRRLG